MKRTSSAAREGAAVAGQLADVVLLVNGPKPPIPNRAGLAAALMELADGARAGDENLTRHAELMIAGWGLNRLVRRARARSSPPT